MQLGFRSPAVALFLQALVATLITFVSAQLTLEEIARRYTERTPGGGIHIPILRWENTARISKRGAVGLGDLYDIIYSALVTINGTTTPLVVDTGSSDLWVISDACLQGCGTAKHYPQATFRSAGIGVELLYGDSRTGTFARGLVGYDSVGLGDINIINQSFVAVNRTNTTLVRAGLAGILGLGFPINSVVTRALFRQQRQSPNSSISTREVGSTKRHLPLSGAGDFRRQEFPSASDILGVPSPESHHQTRQATPPSAAVVQAFIDSWNPFGPFLPRLITRHALPSPLISITLQRNSMDIGGNLGMLSIGELPPTVNASDLTWAYLRNYTTDLGGIPGPTSSPAEAYPITWEIMIENIYLDGERLPASDLAPPGIGLSALVDTGSTLLRGPEDVVSYIQQRLSLTETFDCGQPHNLSFEIGGKIFPIDPRDFATQATNNIVDGCVSTIAVTDPPRVGGYLFSWVLGVPFLKGVLSTYHFGNISYPSHDAPKMGFISTVPSNAGDLMKAGAAGAVQDGTFPAISQAPPSVLPSATITNSLGVPQAKIPENVPGAPSATASTGRNTSDPTLQSGGTCYLVCSSLPLLSSTGTYFILIVAGWNIGLW